MFTQNDNEYFHDLTWHAALRKRRVDLGHSLRDAETLTGISNAYISQVERGRVKSVSFFKLMRLLQAYDMDPEEYCNKYDIRKGG